MKRAGAFNGRPRELRKAMTLTKIGTVKTAAVPSLRTAFWGRGDDKKLSALSSRLVQWLSLGLKANLFGYLSPFLLQSTQEKGDSVQRSVAGVAVCQMAAAPLFWQGQGIARM